jgi:DNA-binding PadR family transcriptional regulator
MLLRYVILALLCDRELHGYAIKAAFEKRVGPLWVLNFGQIYQGLKHLKGQGLITARFDPGNGHLGRWVYTITAKGRRALSTWLKRSPRRPQPLRDEMFIRILALDNAANEDLFTQLAKQERVYREHIAELTSSAQRDEDTLTASAQRDEDVLRALVRAAEVFHAEAQIKWLKHCGAVLGSLQGRGAGRDARPSPQDSRREQTSPSA